MLKKMKLGSAEVLKWIKILSCMSFAAYCMFLNLNQKTENDREM